MTMSEQFKTQLDQKISLAKSANDQSSLKRLDSLVSRASQYLSANEIEAYRKRIGIYKPVKKYSGLKRVLALGVALAIGGTVGYGVHKMSKSGFDFDFHHNTDTNPEPSLTQMSEEDSLVQQFMSDSRTIDMLDQLVAVGNSVRNAGTDISAEQVLDLLPLLARDSYSYKANGIVFAGINNAKRSLDSSLNVSTDAIFRYQQMVDFSPLFEGEEKEFFASLTQLGNNYMEALENNNTQAQKDLQAQYNALTSQYFSNINDSSKSPFATAFAWVADSFDKIGLTLNSATAKQFGESANIDCERKTNTAIFQEAAANFYKLKGEEFEVGARTATSDGYFKTCTTHNQTIAEEIREAMIEYISKRLNMVVTREERIATASDPQEVVNELNRTNTDPIATPSEIAGAIDTNGDGVKEIIQPGNDYSAGKPRDNEGHVILEEHTEGYGKTEEELRKEYGQDFPSENEETVQTPPPLPEYIIITDEGEKIPVYEPLPEGAPKPQEATQAEAAPEAAAAPQAEVTPAPEAAPAPQVTPAPEAAPAPQVVAGPTIELGGTTYTTEFVPYTGETEEMGGKTM